MNYTKKFKFEKDTVLEDVKCGNRILEGYGYYNDEELPVLMQAYPDIASSPTYEYNGWEIKMLDYGPCVHLFINDSGKVNESLTIEEIAEFCKEHKISINFKSIKNDVIDYCVNAPKSCHVIANDICDMIGRFDSSFLCFKTGNCFLNDIIIKDTLGEIHAYSHHCVAVFENSVYDPMHGILDMNIYDYIKHLYENNEHIRLDTSMLKLNMNFTYYFTDTECEFWNRLLDKYRFEEAKPLFEKAHEDYLRRTGGNK